MAVRKVYAVYKGDAFIDVGTADELAARLGVKAQSIVWMTYPSYRKRCDGRNRIEVFHVFDEPVEKEKLEAETTRFRKAPA